MSWRRRSPAAPADRACSPARATGVPILRIPALRAATLCAALLVPGATAAGQVVLLRSPGAGPQETILTGFMAAYRGRVTPLTVEGTAAGRLVQEIAARRPDAIVAVGLVPALFARDQLAGTPVVYCAVDDPKRHDLAGPGITGVSTRVPLARELTLLRTASPAVRRVAVFYGQATGAAFAEEARAAAREAGLELVEVALGNLSELADRARDAVGRCDALWLPRDPTVAASEPFRFLLQLSLEARIPLFTFSDALVRAGALAAVVPDYGSVGAQTAGMVRRIQSGERAGDIPPIVVGEGRLVVNAATARAIGLDLPLAVQREGQVLP